MKTKLGLIQREAAEVVVRDITPIEQFLVVSGVVLWLLVLFALVRWAVLRSEWLTKDPDVPEFVVCTCPPPEEHFHVHNPKCLQHGLNAPHRNSNHVGVLSISDFKRVPTDPKRGA